MSTSIQSLNSYTESHSVASSSSNSDVINQIGSNVEISQFVTSSNVEMLWNIIIQNAAFKSAASTNDTRIKLRQHYITHLKQYVEICIRSNKIMPLIDLNKSFIADFIRGFKENPSPAPRLNLTNTTPVENDVITIEELKAERLSNFDNQYDKMKNDFDQYRVTEVVADTKFTDNTVVEPLKNQDMEDMLSRTLQNRTEQENAAVPRNVSETQRAREWLNLENKNNTINPSEVIQPHPEKKTVTFLPEPSVHVENVLLPKPQEIPPQEIPPQPIQPPLQPIHQPSPIIALQNRVNAIETKLDEMHTMITKLVSTRSNDILVDTEENKVITTLSSNKETEIYDSQTELSQTLP